MAFGHQRAESRKILLREIAQAGPIPRIDLSARTGISRATVTTVTADLLKGGLITEIPRSQDCDSKRGRPKVGLKLSGTAHLVAGIKIADVTISCVLVDFEGRDMATIERPIPPGRRDPDVLARDVSGALNALALAAKVDRNRITGVGVGLAGLVQAETGTVYWSPSLNQRNVPFKDHLEQALSCPVFIDNDANLVAMAELKFGMGRERNDFIVVTIESGVGMGLVLGRQLYRGARGSGGEFGHTKVQLEGALCRCEQRGCLEAYVADYALHREAIGVGLTAMDMSTQSAVGHIIARAEDGDALALNVLDRAGRMFALGLANLINIFDPEVIILAGEQMHSNHLYSEHAMQAMRNSIVDIDKPPPEVVVHSWGNAMWAKGAAAYALEFVQDIAVEALTDVS